MEEIDWMVLSGVLRAGNGGRRGPRWGTRGPHFREV